MVSHPDTVPRLLQVLCMAKKGEEAWHLASKRSALELRVRDHSRFFGRTRSCKFPINATVAQARYLKKMVKSASVLTRIGMRESMKEDVLRDSRPSLRFHISCNACSALASWRFASSCARATPFSSSSGSTVMKTELGMPKHWRRYWKFSMHVLVPNQHVANCIICHYSWLSMHTCTTKALVVLGSCHMLIQEAKVVAATTPHVPQWLELLNESERTVIHSPSCDETVVAIEVALAIAYPNPIYQENENR